MIFLKDVDFSLFWINKKPKCYKPLFLDTKWHEEKKKIFIVVCSWLSSVIQYIIFLCGRWRSGNIFFGVKRFTLMMRCTGSASPSIKYFLPSGFFLISSFVKMKFLYQTQGRYTENRVANVVADHNDLLTQWRPIKMSYFCANIFLIWTTSNYFWASEVSKNQVFKSQFFSSSHASNQWIMKIW